MNIENIPTVNRFHDKYNWPTYTQLQRAELIAADEYTATIRFGGCLDRKIKKKYLLRVLNPYGCYIKKYLLK